MKTFTDPCEHDPYGRFIDTTVEGCDNYDAVFAVKRRGSKRSAPVASHPLDIVTALIVTAGVISMDEMEGQPSQRPTL